jgi:hypothetical protein
MIPERYPGVFFVFLGLQQVMYRRATLQRLRRTRCRRHLGNSRGTTVSTPLGWRSAGPVHEARYRPNTVLLTLAANG